MRKNDIWDVSLIKERVEKSIQVVIQEFRAHPDRFSSEGDIQAFLYHKISSKMPGLLSPISKLDDKKEEYSDCLLHSEEKPDSKNIKNDSFDLMIYHPKLFYEKDAALIAIELKSNHLDHMSLKKYPKGSFLKDLMKMNKIKEHTDFLGYSLIFNKDMKSNLQESKHFQEAMRELQDIDLKKIKILGINVFQDGASEVVEITKKGVKTIDHTKLKEKGNYQELISFLTWADEFNHRNDLSLQGFITYDNDCFDWEYLQELCKKKIIIINKNLGKEVNHEEIDVGLVMKEEGKRELQKILAKNVSSPWYYKGEGKLTSNKLLPEVFKVKNEDEILRKFPITREILDASLMHSIGDTKYWVHADWWGLYFLRLAALAGKEFGEKTFQTKDLYNLREFLLKEKPRGCVLSAVSSDPDCPIERFSMGPIMDLFDYKELEYLKLLFVTKQKVTKVKKDGSGVYATYDKPEIEWVLAYAK